MSPGVASGHLDQSAGVDTNPAIKICRACSKLCQTDVEFGKLHARLDILSTRKFRNATGNSDSAGRVIHDFKFDPATRLIQSIQT